MICPHCGRKGWLPFQSQKWLESYGVGSSCISITECCGKAIKIKMLIKYDVTPHKGNETQDDWGRKIKK